VAEGADQLFEAAERRPADLAHVDRSAELLAVRGSL
jgi:hypothetical protein